MKTYNKYDVAHWFLHQKSMSPKKLQKMLYYAYAWGLVFFNESVDNLQVKVFDGNFESWVHGPVDPDIYKKYASYGYQNIPKYNDNVPIVDDDVLDLFNQIMNIYGGFDGNQLERLTHTEDPWQKARGDDKPLDRSNRVIEDKDMFMYYVKKAS
ncbi:Panacea domain-containing protein [Companilactobacillus paralimentarius]|uniref:Panacea domain-containing protein n=1 Tax=Companilactobacillus paralimentarius TaxID=83526 RepID=UPI00384B3D31